MILDRFKLTDRVAIVTGAGQGIGAGIAVAFAEAGADVVCAARTEADIEDTAARVRAAAAGRSRCAATCTRPGDLEQLVAAALEGFGRIDVLVNNAGGTGAAAGPRDERRVLRARLPLQRDVAPSC